MKNDPAVLATPDYRRFIEDLKARIIQARISAARHVNRDMILLYWDIGRAIMEKQKTLGWGDSVVEMVARDLRRAFPQMRGFSPRNVWYMRRFFEVYGTGDFLQQAVAELPASAKPPVEWRRVVDRREIGEVPAQFLLQLVAEVPWGHHILIIEKLADPAARLWYLQATARLGWSRNVLLNQIKAGTYERSKTDKKTHNFDLALPEQLAEQADEMLKSSYNLNLLNDRERGPGDQPSIGVILCAEKDDIEVEYALRTKANPIGVAAYELQSKLPSEMKGKLPSTRQLRAAVRSALPEEKQEGVRK